MAEGDSSGFGMTVRLVVIAGALFALLWFAIDSNRFHWAPRTTAPGLGSLTDDNNHASAVAVSVIACAALVPGSARGAVT